MRLYFLPAVNKLEGTLDIRREKNLVVMTSHGDGFDGIVFHNAWGISAKMLARKNNMRFCLSPVMFCISMMIALLP